MKKVLIVEDLHEFQEFYADALAGKVAIIPAYTIEEAFAALEQHSDLVAIVMDGCVGTVTINSLPFVKHARQTFKGPMIAASSTPRYRGMLVEAGCDYATPKEDVVELLIKILKLNK